MGPGAGETRETRKFDMMNRTDDGGPFLATVQSGLNRLQGHLIISSRFASAGNQYVM
jgi:hypothetical protein